MTSQFYLSSRISSRLLLLVILILTGSAALEAQLPFERSSLPRVAAGENGTFKYNLSSNFAVYEIAATAGFSASNPSITVQEISLSVVSPAAKLEGKVYKYFSITKGSFPNMTEAIIRFKVSSGWLNLSNADPLTIALNRLTVNNVWEKLPTRQISSAKGYINYEAITAEFSIFAVTAQPNRPSTQELTNDSKNTSLPKLQAATEPNNSYGSQKGFVRTGILVGGAVVLVLVAGMLLRALKKPVQES